MKEIKKEIVKEQIIYEITKEELDKIKKDERNKGRDEMISYVGFCLSNFSYELNLYGISEFISQLCTFIKGKSIGIDNAYEYSFYDYLKLNK